MNVAVFKVIDLYEQFQYTQTTIYVMHTTHIHSAYKARVGCMQDTSCVYRAYKMHTDIPDNTCVHVVYTTCTHCVHRAYETAIHLLHLPHVADTFLQSHKLTTAQLGSGRGLQESAGS